MVAVAGAERVSLPADTPKSLVKSAGINKEACLSPPFHKSPPPQPCSAKALIEGDVLLEAATSDLISMQSLMLIDTGCIDQQYTRWMRELPFIRPYYAVKCNNDPEILKAFARCCLAYGGGNGWSNQPSFDCASPGEIRQVTETLKLAVGDPGTQIIYSNPCKHARGIRFARSHSIRRTVFDNEDELIKIKECMPEAELLLRISTDDALSQCPLSLKFGAREASYGPLLAKAHSLGLKVIGVHFHVGSGCSGRGVFTKATADARRVFDLAAINGGMEFHVLNIGGGFPGDLQGAPGSRVVTFEDLAAEIRSAIDLHFSDVRDRMEFIAEPGRFFAASTCTLVTQIHSRRLLQPTSPHSRAPSIGRESPCSPVKLNDEEDSQASLSTVAGSDGDYETRIADAKIAYFINDGVYGSFNNTVYDHAAPILSRVIYKDSGGCWREIRSLEMDACAGDGTTLLQSTIFGPTCDGFDCVARNMALPLLHVGDCLVFEAMGAYTICAASQFNGFDLPRRIYLRPGREDLH